MPLPPMLKTSKTKATDAGVLKLTGLKKGSYILSEIANTGYDLSGMEPIAFTVTNEDNGNSPFAGHRWEACQYAAAWLNQPGEGRCLR